MVDADRALTPAGQRQMTLVGRGLRKLGVRPQCVVASPLLRARQSAELVVGELGFTDPLLQSDLLLPQALPEELRVQLANYRYAEELLLVGHEPLLSSLALLLCGCSVGYLRVSRGSACRLDVAGPTQAGVLVWLLQPKALALLARA